MGLRLHLDFETYTGLDETGAQVDLTKVGTVRYTRHPTFEVTMTALAFEDDPVLHWDGIPLDTLRTLARIEDLEWHAFNAPFERHCLQAYGVDVPPSRWRCTMAHAYARGFAGSLAQVGEAVGLGEGKAKLAEGKRLVQRFCKPVNTGRGMKRHIAADSPQEWAEFREYNIRDVIAEREIFHYLEQWSWTAEEQRIWELDRRINERGVPVDVEFADKAIGVSVRLSERYDREIKRLTGGIAGKQVARLTYWAKKQGYTEDNLQAGTIRSFLENRNSERSIPGE